jgi:hypothetical protein
MAAGDIVPVPGAQFEETLASASPDVLRAMIREFAQRMMDTGFRPDLVKLAWQASGQPRITR